MDLEEEILSDFSDSEIVESKHKTFLDTISSLDKKTRLKPASRKEPSTQISEYHLVNKDNEDKKKKKLVDVDSLVKSLKKKSNNAHIAKKIAAVHQTKSQTLPKPLEKIHSDKIDRELGFENVKKDVSKWDPIVFDNRIRDNIKFPLKKVDVDLVEDVKKKEKSHHDFLNTFKKPTSLELALANLLDSSTVVTQYREEKEKYEREAQERREASKNSEFKLTLKEMKEKNKEFLKLRAQRAFKEKKAWMQNKIKSKKYHRLMKREKVKEKLKEFEKLQKTNPEAALAQLELLDKSRAEERITLRHKSTGQWAKNLQVRAKYDKEARIALAEQLSQSRALSAKTKQDGDTSDEDKDVDSGVEQDEEEENPWMTREKEDVGAYFSGYRKYWQDKEKQATPSVGPVSMEKLAGTLDDLGAEDDTDIPVFIESTKSKHKDNKPDENKEVENGEHEEVFVKTNKSRARKKENEKINKKGKKKEKRDKLNKSNGHVDLINTGKKISKSKIKNILDRSGKWSVIPVDEGTTGDKANKNKCNKEKTPLKGAKKESLTNGKNVKSPKDTKKTVEIKPDCYSNVTSKKKNKRKSDKLDLSSDLAIDEAFDTLESTWKQQVQKQVKLISKVMSRTQRKDAEKMTKDRKEKRKNNDVDFDDRKKARKTIEIDEAMNEGCGENDDTNTSSDLSKEASLAKELVTETATDADNTSEQEQIDPNQFLKVDKNHRLLSRRMPVALQEGALDDEGGEGESEGEEGETQQMTIEEAFADDDVVQEFRQEKDAETKTSKAEDIDLSLPGWGNWGGSGIDKKATRRKRRRFIIRGVKVPRKDDQKHIVIINEDTPQELKKHLVDKVPYPFTSVKEYEASLRLPLGREWVPEIAHRKLTLPAIQTKLGAVIEPIDYESQARSNLKEHT